MGRLINEFCLTCGEQLRVTDGGDIYCYDCGPLGDVPTADGDTCPHCQSRNTERIDTISSVPTIWFCGCENCGAVFEMVIHATRQ